MGAGRWPVILQFWVGGATVLVNGHRQAYVRFSRHEAARAMRLVSAGCGFGVPVGALIVTVRAVEVVIIQGSPWAWQWYVPRHRLTRWLLPGGELHWLGMLEAVDEVAGTSPMP